MAQQTIAEDHVIDMLYRAQVCDMDEIMTHCSDLRWSQVFLAIDRLSRRGAIRLVPRGRGMYTVTFPHRRDGQPDGL